MLRVANLPTFLCLSSLWLAGCSDGDADDGPANTSGVFTTTTSGNTDDGLDVTSDASSSMGSGPGTDSDMTTGPKLDVGGNETGTAEAGEEGCKAVDFLFVIDNSISMGDEQNNLSNSFPEFIQTIQSQVVADYHVMVVDTDPEDKWDEELAECMNGDCAGEPPDEMCGILPPENMWPCGSLPELDACDPTFGAGVDYSGEDNRVPCGIDNGQRWFDDMQSNQQQVFECIANNWRRKKIIAFINDRVLKFIVEFHGHSLT